MPGERTIPPTISDTQFDCFITPPKKRQKRRPFTSEEDEKLRSLVGNQANPYWKVIAEAMGRSVRQCRERYRDYHAPGVNTGPWTAEEDEKLIELYKKYGSQWALIANHIAGRTNNSIKNRWNNYLKNKSRDVSIRDADSSVYFASESDDSFMGDMFSL